MNSKDLDLILNEDTIVSRYFHGVFAYNELPQKVNSYPACYIVNTGKSDTKGEHWVAVYFENKGFADYFDSYGIPPFGLIYDFVRTNASTVHYNKIWLQSPRSSVCGLYCVYFLHFRARGLPMRVITSQHFAPYDWDRNDAHVRGVVSVLLESSY